MSMQQLTVAIVVVFLLGCFRTAFGDASTTYSSGDNFTSSPDNSTSRDDRARDLINEEFEGFTDDRVLTTVGGGSVENHEVTTGISVLEVVHEDTRTGTDAEEASPGLFTAFFDNVIKSTKRVGTTNGSGWNLSPLVSRMFVNQPYTLALDSNEHAQITADQIQGGIFYAGFTEPVDGASNAVPYSGMVNLMNGVMVMLSLDAFTEEGRDDKSVVNQGTGVKVLVTNGLETDGMDYDAGGGQKIIGPVPADAGDIVGVEVDYLFKDPNTEHGEEDENILHDSDITVDSYTGVRVNLPKKLSGSGQTISMDDFVNQGYGLYVEGGEYDQSKWLGLYSGAGIMVDIENNPNENPQGDATATFLQEISGDISAFPPPSNYGIYNHIKHSGDVISTQSGFGGSRLYGSYILAESVGVSVTNGGETYEETYGVYAEAKNTGEVEGALRSTVGIKGTAVAENGQVSIGVQGIASGSSVNYGGRFAASGSNAYAVYSDGDLFLAGKVVPQSQFTVITSASNSISPTREIVRITANGSYTLSSAPTIPNGVDGQSVTIVNTDSTDTITFQSQAVLANSNLKLSANTISLGPNDSLRLLYVNGDWIQIGFTNIP